MAKKPMLLSDLFHETLKDIYFAENKILKTLPKMAKAAQSKELQKAFTKHLRETEGQVRRLNQVFKIIGKPPRGKTCAAINGITEEGSEIMKDFKGMPALDAGLLAAAQAVEHYEMSRYGTLRTWAEELGLPDAARLLQATLDEEKATDSALTKLAEIARQHRGRTGTGGLKQTSQHRSSVQRVDHDRYQRAHGSHRRRRRSRRHCRQD